ncbi:SDR family NAD(P)-dependent oxidoreductase [Arthrobacter bambusae]|uniref:SDR family NAD(P)-dependent oxidoreductase n=1 Tax=Arthrobacter bambusae TaxID=1338426 RepID=UPI002781D5CF|nr:SDR family oxidoreductase [Arthrobacter bambusae]MDQ0242108.1 NAD(P)-dependent dehydrogenase (short-subunit alcohol dehydrogenase family) [Arthrobacter bambusae]
MSVETASGIELPTFRLDGRTAVVTGASGGLGQRFSQVLAKAGATVYAAARRTDRLEALAATSPGIVPVSCDLSSGEDRARLIETASKGSGRIDVLVNNAGVPGALHIENESTEVLQDVLQINLLSAFDLSKRAGELPGTKDLAIINIASVLGLVSTAPLGGAGYAASKGALIALTRELAGQWGHRGIRVNALAPGWFHTEMTEELFGDPKGAKWVDRNTMLARGGAAAELDGALLFLASAASSYMTGQVLVVDGGWTAR